MKLSFSYNIDKDVENFISGARSMNMKTPTEFHQLFIDGHGKDFDPGKVKAFILEYISSRNIDMNSRVNAFEKAWQEISTSFIERCENIFGITYPRDSIQVYLTTNGLCTYNIEQGYFFVWCHSKRSNGTVMHELFHFYTWHAFYDQLIKKGLSAMQYNDVKESLTELLNIEFKDLLSDEVDSGYPQHKEMRARFKSAWEKHHNLSLALAELP
jgi:hypothetical protein